MRKLLIILLAVTTLSSCSKQDDKTIDVFYHLIDGVFEPSSTTLNMPAYNVWEYNFCPIDTTLRIKKSSGQRASNRIVKREQYKFEIVNKGQQIILSDTIVWDVLEYSNVRLRFFDQSIQKEIKFVKTKY